MKEEVEENSGPVTVSRDHHRRDFNKEAKLVVDNSSEPVPIGSQKADRRTFFKTAIPASGKLLTEFLRSLRVKADTKSD